jgi:hypothetical protein
MQEAFAIYATELIEDILEALIVFIMEPEDERAVVV